MEKIYNPNILEPIVQKYWDKKKIFQVNENTKKKKYYCLSMLPYPSGKLHMGHIRNYTISDIIARYQRMIGKNVLHPIGWDAFGLPAEEAAIKNNTTPKKWTEENIIYMKQQLKKMGFSYDWNREINTCDPEYYKWEQWFFNKLYIHNLVYKKKALIHWCPTDKTVLANEQIINGKCWRCQSHIVTKFIPQWFIKIKKYAKRLLKDLKILKNWPKKVINMQKNWIGKSKGFEILFTIFNSNKTIKIYTTNLKTFMQLTYISISPIHDLAKNEITKKQLKQYIQYIYTSQQTYKNYNELKYLGHQISKYAIHPITQKKIPIWITNYTQIEYNTNIKMSVPEYNNYDRCFAEKYNIKINTNKQETKNNIINKNNQEKISPETKKTLKQKNHSIKNKILEKIFQTLKKKKILKKKTKYKIQDWGISRQRYWGAPIAMVTNKKKKIIPILENKLPIQLPNINSMNEFNDIKKIYKNWSNIKIKNKIYIRETDTFDTFMESSWYYIKYTDPKYNAGMINKKSAKYWLPIDQYIGGIEHATMHLIYFRFLNKLLYDFNFIKSPEPTIKLLCQGMVLANSFYYIKKKQKIWISPDDLKITKDKNGNIKTITANNKKKIICAGMMKMSKSKNNGIDPETIIHKYGADTIRLFIIFSAPINSDIQWNESGIKGMHRFLNKLWKLVYKYIYNLSNTTDTKKYDTSNIKYNLHTTILKVSNDIHTRQSFNTAISQIIKFTNYIFDIYKTKKIKKSLIKKILNIIIKLLYPFAPHISFILWNKINKNKNIDYESWPKYNKKYTIKNKINFIIQINGKKKKILCINNNSSQIEILSILKKDPILSKNLKNTKKTIYIPNKLINLII